MELVLASRNVHKIREFREMLKEFSRLDVVSLLNFTSYNPPPEIGDTFQDNAKSKALHAAKTLNKWVLADDSGLVVPALSGAPGVRSSRYAGDDAHDAENRRKLIKEMGNLDGLQRDAHFECSLVLASPDGFVKCVSATIEGSILRDERGRNGFGYDTLFIKYGYDKSFAEIDENTKNRISHRRKAFDKLIPSLEMMLK